MTDEKQPRHAEQEIEQIIQTARTLGVEVDETDVTQWLAAMAASSSMAWDVDEEAGIYGGRMALKCTALVPLVMAIGYLILVIYFYMKGGYKAEVLHGEEPDGEHYTGGVEGPVE